MWLNGCVRTSCIMVQKFYLKGSKSFAKGATTQMRSHTTYNVKDILKKFSKLPKNNLATNPSLTHPSIPKNKKRTFLVCLLCNRTIKSRNGTIKNKKFVILPLSFYCFVRMNGKSKKCYRKISTLKNTKENNNHEEIFFSIIDRNLHLVFMIIHDQKQFPSRPLTQVSTLSNGTLKTLINIMSIESSK